MLSVITANCIEQVHTILHLCYQFVVPRLSYLWYLVLYIILLILYYTNVDVQTGYTLRRFAKENLRSATADNALYPSTAFPAESVAKSCTRCPLFRAMS